MNRPYSGPVLQLLQSKIISAVIVALVALAPPPALHAMSVPDWVRQAAAQTLPTYSAETDAVLLLDEQITTVKDNGDIMTLTRRVYKILRPNGRSLANVRIGFDKDTKLTYLKGWSISAKGEEYEVKEKDAIETSLFSDAFFEDTRHKLLTIPAADPGAVIAYEFEQRDRPFVFQDEWHFQDEYPTRTARFTLKLPAGWEYEAHWANHAPFEPLPSTAGQTTWQINDVPAIESERDMPTWRAVAGRLVLNYFPRKEGLKDKVHTSWQEVGAWHWNLASNQRDASPALKQRVTELTAAATTKLDKVKALARFAQQDVRYVAIEIGIGGYQPHRASEVFTNRYGDCKDKATLLSSMLREIGVDSYYILINTNRGYVKPEIPSTLSFNHVILGIKLPPDSDPANLFSMVEVPKLGKLLIFDPTDDRTAFGYLPSYEQENYGLVVTESGGILQKIPLEQPETNRLIRTAKLELSPDGTLAGAVQEVRSGSFATATRSKLLSMKGSDRAKWLETFLGSFLGDFRITQASVGNLENYEKDLVLNYSFVANNYAKSAGALLLIKPRVMGEKSDEILETVKERKYPVEFDEASVQKDVYDIALPSGFEIDELPDPLQIDYPFAQYTSKTEVNGKTLVYTREMRQREVVVPLDAIQNLRKFYREIASEERSSAVLKKSVSN